MRRGRSGWRGASGAVLAALLFGCQGADFDHQLILRQGTVYDGSGQPAFVTDVAVDGDRITAIGDLEQQRGEREIDIRGLAGPVSSTC